MIVPMKHLTLVCLADTREQTLQALRDLGVLHVTVEPSDAESVRETHVRIFEAERALRILTAVEKHAAPPRVETRLISQDAHIDTLLAQQVPTLEKPGSADELIADINHIGSVCVELITEEHWLKHEAQRYLPFGHFDPASIRDLAHQGLQVRLFRQTKKDIEFPVVPGCVVQPLGQTPEGLACGVIVGDTAIPEGFDVVPPPLHPTDWYNVRRHAVASKITDYAVYLEAIDIRRPEIEQALAARIDAQKFAQVSASMRTHADTVAYLTGYMPAEALDVVREAARVNAWGLQMRDPHDGDAVPTLLRPPRLFRPILTLFDTLGITPAYNETDISVPFFAFFGIFFAMLVGDAGYGAILLAGTLWARRKLPKAPAAPFILMTVFSVATILWGVATATYFGIPVAALPNALNHPLAVWFADQSNIMQFCFTLGLIHLVLARLWNAVQLAPDTKAIAQIGWIGVLVAMYNIICGIVVQGFHTPTWNTPLLIASSLAIALFMLKKSELKTNGVDLGMLPLNIISSMGDIISYVRLFAVGMASVKVAENFNLMATDLALPLWAKIPLMVLILLFGHVLNLAMGGLSILVHAVRLNTLEFSGAKGLSWAGFAYKPFRGKTSAT